MPCSPAEERQRLINFERLGDEIESAFFDGLHCDFQRALRRHYDNLGVRTRPAKLARHFKPVDVLPGEQEDLLVRRRQVGHSHFAFEIGRWVVCESRPVLRLRAPWPKPNPALEQNQRRESTR
jgi:hypothetical protein